MEKNNAYPVWPGWETLEVIGQGSFGSVYRIRRNTYDTMEEAALKVIPIPQKPSDIQALIDKGYDEQSISSTLNSYLKNFVNEYALMKKLSGVSNVVNCDDFISVPHKNEPGWDILIKMELLTPLTKALPRHPGEEQVIRVGKDLCRALILCEKNHIIHRDIKPQNIFVSRNGDYKLGDFGIAKTIEKTQSGTLAGTFSFMAPEVAHYQPYNHTADIYSLGLVLYWMLNEHRSPFMPLPPAPASAEDEEAAKTRRLNGDPLPAPAYGCDQLKQIVLRACASLPEARYQSAAEMLSDLEALEREKGSASSGTVSLDSVTEIDPNRDSVTEIDPNRVSVTEIDPNCDSVTEIDPSQNGGTSDISGQSTGSTDNGGSSDPLLLIRSHKKQIALIAAGLLLAAGIFAVLRGCGGSSSLPAATSVPAESPTARPEAAPASVPETSSSYPGIDTSQLISIYENPADQTVSAGGSAAFTAVATNWSSCAWRLVSPDGLDEVLYDEVPRVFPGLTAEGGATAEFCLDSIPKALDGWSAVCLFTDSVGGMKVTRGGVITVEGTVTPEPTPEPTPASTPAPAYPDLNEVMRNYRFSLYSDKDVRLFLPGSDLTITPFRATVVSTIRGESIYVMPRPETGNGNLGNVADGTGVWIMAAYGEYYFFVADDGHVGWNGSRFFRQ